MDRFNPDSKTLAYLENKIARLEKPDEPILFAGTKGYSYRQILDEIRASTDFGRNFYNSMEVVLMLEERRKYQSV
jgi:hypothetical protein